jgi:hypothetical protein
MAKNPINRDSLKKLLDTVTPMNPDTAERFVREVMRIGDERRRDAERLMNEVTAAGRKSAEHFTASVQQEVAKQLGRVVHRIDALERQLETVNRNLEVTRTAVASAASKAVSRALPGSGIAEKEAAGKKAGDAKNGSGAKKAAAKKPAAKKSAGKKSAGKNSAGKNSKNGSKKKSPAKSSGSKAATSAPATQPGTASTS